MLYLTMCVCVCVCDFYFWEGGVTPLYLVGTRENTRCFKARVLYWRRHILWIVVLFNLLKFVNFENPMGSLTWYLFFLYMGMLWLSLYIFLLMSCRI